MSVINIALTYVDLGIGGIQKVIVEHIRFLRALGHPLTLYLQLRAEHECSLPADVTVIHLCDKGVTDQERLEYFRGSLVQRKIALVWNHDIYTDFADEQMRLSKNCGCTLFYQFGTFFMRFLKDLNPRLGKFFAAMHHVDLVVAPSRTDRFFLNSLGISCAVLPNPLAQWNKTAVCEGTDGVVGGGLPSGSADSRPAERRRGGLVWVGRLHQSAKQYRALPAFLEQLVALVPDAHLTVVGAHCGETENEAAFYQELSDRALNDHITIVEDANPEQVAAALSENRVFVCTSSIEGFSVAILEAFAAGLPVVMFELPWLELVKDNPAVLQVAQGDTAALAKEAARLLRFNELTDALSQVARQRNEQQAAFDFPQFFVDVLSQTYSDAKPTAEALLAEYDREEAAFHTAIINRFMLFYGDQITKNHALALEQMRQAEATAHQLKQEKERAEAELQSVYASHSWKLTRPLRRIVEALGGKSQEGTV